MNNNNDLKTRQSTIRNPKSDETRQSIIRNPKLVLIIDDSEDDLLLTSMVLRKINAELTIESALSGEGGLTLLRSGTEPPALVLLDLKMPGMDGFEVLRAVRADERLRSVPVIVVTHSDLESDKEASDKSGANGFLNKSVDLDQFTKDLRVELERWM